MGCGTGNGAGCGIGARPVCGTGTRAGCGTGAGAAVQTCRERGQTGAPPQRPLSSLLLLLLWSPSPPSPLPSRSPCSALPGVTAVPRRGHRGDPGQVTPSFGWGREGSGSPWNHLLVFTGGLVVWNWQLRRRFCDFSGRVWKGG